MPYKGSCHCGAVTFEVQQELQEGIVCNCSICHRKGTILAMVPDSKVIVHSGFENLTDYQFGKKRVHHYFCSTCGVTTFGAGQMPDGQKIKAINLRCLTDFDLKKLPIKEVNGKDF